MSLRPMCVMALFLALACAGVAPAFAQSPQDKTGTHPRPAWADEYMRSMIGTWIADNSAFKSEQEPFDAFGIEWSWGIGRQSLVGRLFGLREGKEVGPFWEFREFWHPGEGQLLASQFSPTGTYGVGPHTRKADGTYEMLQVFHDPSGGTMRVGHRSRVDGNEMTSQSFDVAEDGTWKPRRRYVWRKKS